MKSEFKIEKIYLGYIDIDKNGSPLIQRGFSGISQENYYSIIILLNSLVGKSIYLQPAAPLKLPALANVLMNKFQECISWDENYNRENPIIELGLSEKDEDFQKYISARQIFLKSSTDNPEYLAYLSNKERLFIAKWLDRKRIDPKKIKSIGKIYRELASDYISNSNNSQLLDYGQLFLENNQEFQTFNFIKNYNGTDNQKIYNNLRSNYIEAHAIGYIATNPEKIPCLNPENLFKYAKMLGIFDLIGRNENINSRVLFSIRNTNSIHEINSHYLSCYTQEDIDIFLNLPALYTSKIDIKSIIGKFNEIFPKTKYIDINAIPAKKSDEFDLSSHSKDLNKLIHSFKIELAKKMKF